MTKQEKLDLQLLAKLVLIVNDSANIAFSLASLYKQQLTKHEFVRQRLAIGSWFAEKGYGGTAYELAGEAISYLAARSGDPQALRAKLVLAVGYDKAENVWPKYCAWQTLLGDGEPAIEYYNEVLTCSDGKV